MVMIISAVKVKFYNALVKILDLLSGLRSLNDKRDNVP